MNERIIELRKEAYNLIQTDLQTNERDEVVDNREHLKMVFDKFAELIIQECHNAVLSVPCYYKDYRSQIEHSVIHDCANSIKQHFDIEQ